LIIAVGCGKQIAVKATIQLHCIGVKEKEVDSGSEVQGSKVQRFKVQRFSAAAGCYGAGGCADISYETSF